MKMQEKIEPVMFAPCGMNCLVCYKHCYHKKPCAGCLKSDQGKPEHCRKCRIKDCVAQRQITYCFECPEYPCKQIKRLEKSYNTRYHTSLMENSKMVKEQGIAVDVKTVYEMKQMSDYLGMDFEKYFGKIELDKEYHNFY